MLLAQPLQRLVLSDLHARAHVAVSVHEESESARQMFAAGQNERSGFNGGAQKVSLETSVLNGFDHTSD